MPIAQLTKPQSDFAESTAKEAWFDGGLGSGKTTAGSYTMRMRAFADYMAHPHDFVSFLLLAESPESADQMLDHLELDKGRALRSRPARRFFLGRRLILDVSTYRHALRGPLVGPVYNGIWADNLELADNPEDIVRSARLRARNGSQFLLVTCTGLSRLASPDATVVNSSTGDNPSLDSDYAKRLQELG